MKEAPVILAGIFSAQMVLFVPSVSLASDASCDGTAVIATGNYIPDVVTEETHDSLRLVWDRAKTGGCNKSFDEYFGSIANYKRYMKSRDGSNFNIVAGDEVQNAGDLADRANTTPLSAASPGKSTKKVGKSTGGSGGVR